MHIRDIINNTCVSQPEGMELLDIIKVTFNDVQSQYLNCMLMQKMVEIKLDMEKLKSKGYTLNEVLIGTAGVGHEEAERFVLIKLQEFVKARESQNRGAGSAPQNNS